MLRNEFTRHILPAPSLESTCSKPGSSKSALVEVEWRGKAQLKQFVLTLVELGRLFVVHREWRARRPWWLQSQNSTLPMRSISTHWLGETLPKILA